MTNAIPNVPRELKPCPFCGDSELLGFEPSNEGGWTIVRCRRCGASGSTGRSTSEWEAAAYWNRRDPSPAGVDADHIEDVRAMVADPSPAGVDGLEVATFLHALHMELGQTEQFCSKWKGDPFGVSGVDYSSTYSVTSEPLCRLSDAQAIIDGLRGEADQQAQRIGELEGLLLEVAASLAWNAHGECRAIHDGPIMPSQMALDAVKAALGGSL